MVYYKIEALEYAKEFLKEKKDAIEQETIGEVMAYNNLSDEQWDALTKRQQKRLYEQYKN